MELVSALEFLTPLRVIAGTGLALLGACAGLTMLYMVLNVVLGADRA
jgi:glutamine amidotransferase PdxT